MKDILLNLPFSDLELLIKSNKVKTVNQLITILVKNDLLSNSNHLIKTGNLNSGSGSILPQNNISDIILIQNLLDFSHYFLNFNDNIGEGGFGSVYTINKIDTNELFVLKLIKNDNDSGTKSFMLEFVLYYLLNKICKDSIITLYGYTTITNYNGLIMELMGGDISNLKLNEYQFKDFCIQMLKNLKCIHNVAITHRDIKPGNIFYRVTPNGEIVYKFGDFGLSCIFSNDHYQYYIDIINKFYPELTEQQKKYIFYRCDNFVGTPGYISKKINDNYYLNRKNKFYDYMISDLDALGKTFSIILKYNVTISDPTKFDNVINLMINQQVYPLIDDIINILINK